MRLGHEARGLAGVRGSARAAAAERPGSCARERRGGTVRVDRVHGGEKASRSQDRLLVVRGTVSGSPGGREPARRSVTQASDASSSLERMKRPGIGPDRVPSSPRFARRARVGPCDLGASLHHFEIERVSRSVSRDRPGARTGPAPGRARAGSMRDASVRRAVATSTRERDHEGALRETVNADPRRDDALALTNASIAQLKPRAGASVRPRRRQCEHDFVRRATSLQTCRTREQSGRERRGREPETINPIRCPPCRSFETSFVRSPHRRGAGRGRSCPPQSSRSPASRSGPRPPSPLLARPLQVGAGTGISSPSSP